MDFFKTIQKLKLVQSTVVHLLAGINNQEYITVFVTVFYSFIMCQHI